jgi:hypothetical protein
MLANDAEHALALSDEFEQEFDRSVRGRCV